MPGYFIYSRSILTFISAEIPSYGIKTVGIDAVGKTMLERMKYQVGQQLHFDMYFSHLLPLGMSHLL